MYYRADSNGKEILVLHITKIYPVNPVYFIRIFGNITVKRSRKILSKYWCPTTRY